MNISGFEDAAKEISGLACDMVRLVGIAISHFEGLRGGWLFGACKTEDFGFGRLVGL